MMDGWDGMGAAGWLLMSVLWMFLIVAIVWGLANLFPKHGASDAGITHAERPEDILDRRLARGEIDIPTYDDLRSKLRAVRAERV